MQYSLFVAMFVGLLAPLLRARAWRVPFGWLSLGTVLRAVFGGLVTTFLAGLLFGLMLRGANTTEKAIDLTAAGAAALFGLTLVFSSARRNRGLRGLHVVLTQLADPGLADEAAERADAMLREARGTADGTRLALYAAGPLTRADRWTQALRHLEALTLDPVADARAFALRGQALATCHMQEGALEEADVALTEIPRPAPPEIEPWLIALEAWIRVIAGGADRALELIGRDGRVGEDDEPDTLSALALGATHDMIAAHAFASMGRDDEARALLESVASRAGGGALAQAIRPVGPATDIAREVVASFGTNGPT